MKRTTMLLKSGLSDALYQRTKRVFKSIPKQLSKENKKFMYKSAEANARSREYAEATQTLCNFGLARKLPRLIEGSLPLDLRSREIIPRQGYNPLTNITANPLILLGLWTQNVVQKQHISLVFLLNPWYNHTKEVELWKSS